MPSDSRIIIGTAGHVDHGKTTLVRALTGLDTDRLPEEKRREISIELGFAPFLLPSGKRAGIVDVPGHEKFVHHMASGAYGMDLVLFVVAASEGIMPQTVEHLQICTLLGVRQGIIVLTKADLVDAGKLVEVEADVRIIAQGTFLESAPAFAVSAADGRGMAELVAAIDAAVAALPARPASGVFRLPIDRAFTKSGFGTIVTGTLHGGTVRPGDTLLAVPPGREVRVRQVQVHGGAVEAAYAGQRVALNLAGASVADGLRGALLIDPKAPFVPAKTLYTSLTLLPAAATVTGGETLSLHALTFVQSVHLVFLDADAPGNDGTQIVRIGSRQLVWLLPGDRFVLRRLSPAATVAGGIVITTGGRFRKGREEDLADLRLLAAGGEEGRLEVLSRREIVLATADAALVHDRHPNLVASGSFVDLGRRLAGGAALAERLRRLQRHLAEAAASRAPSPGVPIETIRGRIFPELEAEELSGVLKREASAGRLDLAPGVVGARGALSALESAAAKVSLPVLEALLAAGARPPEVGDLAAATRLSPSEVDRALKHLIATDRALRLSGIVFAKDVVDGLARRTLAYLDAHGEITAGAFRDLADTSRKYAIPLLEHFDSRHLTRRRGDVRVRF